MRDLHDLPTPLYGPEIGIAWGDVTDAVVLSTRILQDPYLPQAIKLVTQIADASTGPSGVNAGQPGIGLRDAIFPLKVYLYSLKHPWVPWVAGAGVFLVPFLLGLAVARLTQK
jgi:hypothetical protein